LDFAAAIIFGKMYGKPAHHMDWFTNLEPSDF